MILTDGDHLVSDMSLQELHEFARKIGLKRHWFQRGRKGGVPHYDLLGLMHQKALVGGAIAVLPEDIVERAVRA